MDHMYFIPKQASETYEGTACIMGWQEGQTQLWWRWTEFILSISKHECRFTQSNPLLVNGFLVPTLGWMKLNFSSSLNQLNTEIGKLYGARLKPHFLLFRVLLNRTLPNIILAGEALNVQNPLKNATEVLNWTIASLANAIKQFCCWNSSIGDRNAWQSTIWLNKPFLVVIDLSLFSSQTSNPFSYLIQFLLKK